MTIAATRHSGSRPIVALATSAEFPLLAPDDRLLANQLEAIGIEVSIRIWSDESAWQTPADLVVIRSCWDYHLDLPRFLTWLADLDARGFQIANPRSVVEWNARKSYLIELDDAGIETGVPTALIHTHGDDSVASRVQGAMTNSSFDWSDIIAKPEVSGTAWETCRLRPLDSHEDMQTLESLIHARNTIVQPFIEDIISMGELSLIYFGGAFSHAVAKRSVDGDFRVQEEFGGSAVPCEPPVALVDYADRVLTAAAHLRSMYTGDLTYARVDVINGLPPRLMEMELIEPGLFLDMHPLASTRFAQQIARLVVTTSQRSAPEPP